MLGIQVSIGALNDLVDVPLDAARKPGKPIPAGLVSARAARLVASGGGVVALGLSAPSGALTVAAAVGGLGCGYLYDLRLSRTALSWLPLAIALPLLPIHAWLGATGTVPPGLIGLLPAGFFAGAALALANAVVDIDRDSDVGRRTIAVRLGQGRAWAANVVMLGAVALMVVMIGPVVPPDGPERDLGILRAVRLAGFGLGSAAAAFGAVVLTSRRAAIRERGWELEAIGIAAIGLGWLAGTAATVAGGGAGV